MPLYGIRDRSPFVQYNTSLTPTKQQGARYGIDNKRYYSSTDAEIYFGSYYVDEIVQIQYQVEQSNTPLFGYNAYVFDEMAIGSRIISGQFTINMTRPGYLYELLDLLSQESVSASTQDVQKEDDGTAAEAAPAEPYGGIHRSKRPLWSTGFDIDIMLGQEDSINSARHIMLEGVHIGSTMLGLDATGAPVTETYSFIARDIRPID